MSEELITKDLGCKDFVAVWSEMQAFTAERKSSSVDELWFVEHPPVFTQGVAGKEEHILDSHNIPVVRTNRGGQVTYHGPGQIVMYTLFNLRRKNMGVRALVSLLEDVVIELLEQFKISANAKAKAPGVYVQEKKIAALGLRVSRGCSYHGLSLNVDLDLTPFDWINPCGYKGLEVTRLRDQGVNESAADIKKRLTSILVDRLGYRIVSEM